eukprot:351987-Prorocentrum_minimum.AAC.1
MYDGAWPSYGGKRQNCPSRVSLGHPEEAGDGARGDQGLHHHCHIDLKNGQPLQLLACGDRDKQPMFLLGTCSTSAAGEERKRVVTTVKAD